MTEADYKHEYRVGDAVLADINGALIPGVVEDKREDNQRSLYT